MQRRTISDAVRGEIITRTWEGETFARIARDLGVFGRTRLEASRCARAASPPEPS